MLKKAHSFLIKRLHFALAYLFFGVTTLLLPQFGSSRLVASLNEAAQSEVMLVDGDFTVAKILHAACFAILILLAWFRGRLVGLKLLVILPIFATAITFAPFLSDLEYVVAGLHLLTILLGSLPARKGRS